MRKILLALLLLCFCGLTPAQKKLLLQGEPNYQNIIRSHSPTFYAESDAPTELPPLVHYLAEDNAASTVVVDKSGNYAGTASANTDTFDAAAGSCKVGKCFLFDVATSHKIDAGADVIGTGADTVCAWVAPTDATPALAMRIADNGKYLLGISAQAKLQMSSDTATVIESAAVFADATFAHVCASRTATGAASLYLNGALLGAADQDSGTPTAGTGNVIIGNRAASDRDYGGYLDDIRIYDRALTAAEITQIYNSGTGHQFSATSNSGQRIVLDALGGVLAWQSEGKEFYQSTVASRPVKTRSDNLENVYLSSGNISSGWTANAGATINDATKFTATAQNGAVYQSILLPNPARVCATMRAVSGNTNLHFIHVGAGCSGGGITAVTVTGTLATYCVTVTGCTAAGATGIQDRNAAGFGQIEVTAQWAQSALADSTYIATTTLAQYRGMNGKPVVRFDGVDDWMVGPTSGTLIATTARTLILGIRHPALVSGYSLAQDNLYWAMRSINNGKYYITSYDANLDTASIDTPLYTAESPMIYLAGHDGTNIYGKGNSGPWYSAASGTLNGGAAAQPMTIGRATAEYSNGSISTLATFNKAIPVTDLTRIQRGLCRKYGANC
jgi:hypothetical protein